MATNASISELQREKETFQDLLPNVIETLLKETRFKNMPEVANWTKEVGA